MSSRQSSPYESKVSGRLLAIIVLALLVVPASAQTFQSLFEFIDYHEDGAVPAEVAPTQGRDGLLYGSTNQGGAFSQGTIFKFDPSTNTHTNEVNPFKSKMSSTSMCICERAYLRISARAKL